MKAKVVLCSLALSLPLVSEALTDDQKALRDSIRVKPLLDPGKQQSMSDDKDVAPERAQASAESISKEIEQQDVPKGPTFELTAVRFNESVYLTGDDLRPLIQPLLGTQVSFADLQTLRIKIIELYQSKGIYTATATLPQQKIKDGVVYFRLVEGSLGSLSVSHNEYTDEKYVRKWLRNDEQVSAIDINALEMDILLYNRVNDQQLQAELQRGKEFGLTDIVIKVQEPERDQLYLFWDNYGVKSTGRNELGLLYTRQKLWLDGDRATVHALHSGNTNLDFKKDWDFFRNETGIASLNLGYNAPIKQTRWRLGGTASTTHTDIINGDFSDVGVTGQSDRISIDSTYLAYNEKYQWLTVLLGADHTWSESNVESTVAISEYKIAQYYGGVQFNWLSNLWQLNVSQVVNYGYVDDKLLEDDQEAFIAKGDVMFVGQIPEYKMYGIVKANYQKPSESALVGSLSYSLGGPNSIRGYEPGFVSGDEGFYVNVEAHYNGLRAWNHNFDFYVFHDRGEALSSNPAQKLTSVGLGFSVSGSSNLAFDFTAAESHKIVDPDQPDWLLFGRLTCQCF